MSKIVRSNRSSMLGAVALIGMGLVFSGSSCPNKSSTSPTPTQGAEGITFPGTLAIATIGAGGAGVQLPTTATDTQNNNALLPITWYVAPAPNGAAVTTGGLLTASYIPNDTACNTTEAISVTGSATSGDGTRTATATYALTAANTWCTMAAVAGDPTGAKGPLATGVFALAASGTGQGIGGTAGTLKLYVGTVSGLSTYNGATGTWSGMTTAPGQLAANAINMNGLAVDSTGTVWVAPASKNLQSFNGAAWTTFAASIPNANVTGVAIDPSNNVYIGTSASAAYLPNTAAAPATTTTAFVPLPTVTAGTTVITFDAATPVDAWFGASAGVQIFPVGSTATSTAVATATFASPALLLPGRFGGTGTIGALYRDTNNNMWVGQQFTSLSGSQGLVLNVYTPPTSRAATGGTWTKLPVINSTTSSGSNTVNGIAVDGNGNAWIATAGGLYLFQPTTAGNYSAGTWTSFPVSSNGQEGPVGVAINAIWYDSGASTLWIGTNAGGLTRLWLPGYVYPVTAPATTTFTCVPSTTPAAATAQATYCGTFTVPQTAAGATYPANPGSAGCIGTLPTGATAAGSAYTLCSWLANTPAATTTINSVAVANGACSAVAAPNFAGLCASATTLVNAQTTPTGAACGTLTGSMCIQQ